MLTLYSVTVFIRSPEEFKPASTECVVVGFPVKDAAKQIEIKDFYSLDVCCVKGRTAT